MSIKSLKTFHMEDDPVFQKIVENELKKRGVKNIQIFDNADIFMASVKKGPDFVILDFSLNDLNGLDLLKYIKKHRRRTYVVILSSLTDEEVIKKCLDHGAKEFIDKGDDTAFEKLGGHLKKAAKKKTIFRIVTSTIIFVIVAAIILFTLLQ